MFDKRLQPCCGLEHSVCIDSQGDVWCWGNNSRGQIGDSISKRRTVPEKVQVPQAKSISCGDFYTVIVDTNNEVWTFGDNRCGQLGLPAGLGYIKIPQLVNGLSNISFVYCGSNHTICLSSDCTLYGFGRNDLGQLGLGIDLASNIFCPKKISLNISHISDIACGGSHSMIINEGIVYATGLNSYGQLGLDDEVSRFTFTEVKNLPFVFFVSCGHLHSIFLSSQGDVLGCGYNYSGELGLGVGDRNERKIPTKINSLPSIQFIACSKSNTMAVDDEDELWSFGDGTFVPEKLIEVGKVASLSIGGSHTLIKDKNGAVWMFGEDNSSTDIRQKVLKPKQLPEKYWNIIGISQQSRAKSARK